MFLGDAAFLAFVPRQPFGTSTFVMGCYITFVNVVHLDRDCHGHGGFFSFLFVTALHITVLQSVQLCLVGVIKQLQRSSNNPETENTENHQVTVE
jgi:hypothetical protein